MKKGNVLFCKKVELLLELNKYLNDFNLSSDDVEVEVQNTDFEIDVNVCLDIDLFDDKSSMIIGEENIKKLLVDLFG